MNFVNIETFYNSLEDRNIQQLVNNYNNLTLLKSKIISVGNEYLNNSELIKNKNVLLKPNWVLHNRQGSDEMCLRTNNQLIIALVEILLEQKPTKILIGDAPIQDCDWDRMITNEFKSKISELSTSFDVPIILSDFRRVTFNSSTNNLTCDKKPLDHYLVFNLGNNSFLEPISSPNNIFRVNKYDPDRLAKAHKTDVHKYCITKELFDADVVISLPKIKTHQKTGITGALKNLVGLNGDKDFLPHHRFGGKGYGGDCYPGKNILRLTSEYLLDMANRRRGNRSYKSFLFFSKWIWRFSSPSKLHSLSAGWYGNDTTWRMVLDLNKIANYGKSNGTISDKPQRTVFSLCDGIIGGQGNGPLNPDPLPLGVISFTNCSSINDICLASLMGYDYRKFPLLFNSINRKQIDKTIIKYNEEKISFENLKIHSIQTIPPSGWQDYL